MHINKLPDPEHMLIQAKARTVAAKPLGLYCARVAINWHSNVLSRDTEQLALLQSELRVEP
jgi:hypothetical protein